MSRPATAPAASSPRRPTNVTLPESLLREARELGINLCQACGTGLGAEVAATRRNRWLAAEPRCHGGVERACRGVWLPAVLIKHLV